MGTVVRGVVGLGKLVGKGLWLVLKVLAAVLTLGVVAYVRHRKNKKLRDRASALESKEQALDQRMAAMEAKEAGAAEAASPAPAAPPDAPPATE
jgi:hypothetical protein